MHNGYPANFIRTSSVPVTQEEGLTSNKEDEEKESQPLMVIPYIAGKIPDVCAENLTSEWFSSQDGHFDRCWSRSRICYLLESNPM